MEASLANANKASQKEIDLKDIKILMLEMLDEIDEFCRNLDIKYFLVGGSLLGAIRHNGFIPWDDDIDIGMPRKDYEKFIQTFTSETGVTKIVGFNNTKNYIWPFAKAIHTKTILIEKGCEKCPIGVYIDIFPIDKIEGTYEDACKRVAKVQKYKKLLTLKHLSISKKRSFLKNLVIFFGKGLNIVSDKYLIKKINNIISIDRDSQNTEYMCNFVGAWGGKEIMPAECFSETDRRSFENREYNILKNYDEYLKILYGDYMTVPPLDKQISHHSYSAYWGNFNWEVN